MADSKKPLVARNISISDNGITLEGLGEKLAVRTSLVVKKLLDQGIFAMPNQVLDAKLASDVAHAFGGSVRIEPD